ncbi:MAG TPA: hypothetical protein VKU01_21910 [Bryobacteraceae bacterium]|nr:hypothetical protein [Bryobacteraceae bacterium]
MNRERVRKIADAVLYEGYLLYPYRRTSVKNQQRWTFGGLYPEAWAKQNGDRSSLHTEMLVEGDSATEVGVTIRFLHLLAREDASGVWQEGVEREVALEAASLGGFWRVHRFSFPAARVEEDGVVRHHAEIIALAQLDATLVGERLWKLTVEVRNLTEFSGSEQATRDEASLQALTAAHVITETQGGRFVSLADPPDHVRIAAAACVNDGVWPVLIGADCMLASPIILSDDPEIAPESPGDLFDGGEIDEILTLRILTLTEGEKQEMRTTDERTRRILERSEGLSAEQLMRLHGLVKPSREWKAGDLVRLRPRKSADIMDIALAGKVAEIESVDVDYDDQVHLAVVLQDDPGRDLGVLRQPGHRFFFSPDEVEPIAS